MKFSKNTLRSVKIRHIFGLQQTWSYDRYQGSGYCYGILPALKEAAGDDREQLGKLMKSNMSFFNTSAIFSPLITGVHMALLENDSDEMGQSIKTSMMGPLAGVGDTLAGVIFNPLVTLLSCQFGLGGNWFMALMLTLAIRVAWLIVQSRFFDLGYHKGVEAISSAASHSFLTQGIHFMSVFGAVILGGFIPKQLGNIQIGLEYVGKVSIDDSVERVFRVQEMFDGIMPYMVPLILLALVYFMIKKVKLSALQMLLLIFALAVICYYTNLFVLV